MGLYRSSITGNQGTRSVEHYYGSDGYDAADCHQKNFEMRTGETVHAQKVTPAKGVEGFPDTYKGE